MIRGTMPDMEPGTIWATGRQDCRDVGKGAQPSAGRPGGDPSTIACGYCAYCRAGYCRSATTPTPKGAQAGTAFFGGPASPARFTAYRPYARVPFANVGPFKLPGDLDDEQAIMLSDIFPTGYFGATLAGIKPGHTVAVFDCGPVGLFTIVSARLMGAGGSSLDPTPSSRLDMARRQGIPRRSTITSTTRSP